MRISRPAARQSKTRAVFRVESLEARSLLTAASTTFVFPNVSRLIGSARKAARNVRRGAGLYPASPRVGLVPYYYLKDASTRSALSGGRRHSFIAGRLPKPESTGTPTRRTPEIRASYGICPAGSTVAVFRTPLLTCAIDSARSRMCWTRLATPRRPTRDGLGTSSQRRAGGRCSGSLGSTAVFRQSDSPSAIESGPVRPHRGPWRTSRPRPSTSKGVALTSIRGLAFLVPRCGCSSPVRSRQC